MVAEEVTPSPEVRAILREFCRQKEAELGPEWKAILADRMTRATMPFVEKLFECTRNVPRTPRDGADKPDRADKKTL